MFSKIKDATNLLPEIVEIITDYASTPVYHISDGCFGLVRRHGVEHIHYVQEDCLSEPTHCPTAMLDEIYVNDDQKELKKHLRHFNETKIDTHMNTDTSEIITHKAHLVSENCSAITKLKLTYHFKTWECSITETCKLVTSLVGADCRAVFIDNGPKEVTIFYNCTGNLTDKEEKIEYSKRELLFEDEFVMNILLELNDQQLLSILLNFNFMEYYIKKSGPNFVINEITHYNDSFKYLLSR